MNDCVLGMVLFEGRLTISETAIVPLVILGTSRMLNGRCSRLEFRSSPDATSTPNFDWTERFDL
jgi:hypothetical protein